MTVEEIPVGDRPLIADFLRRVSRKQVRNGTVIRDPDGADQLLTGSHALVFTAPIAWLRRRLDGEEVAFVDVGLAAGLTSRFHVLTDGTRFVGAYPTFYLEKALAGALPKSGR